MSPLGYVAEPATKTDYYGKKLLIITVNFPNANFTPPLLRNPHHYGNYTPNCFCLVVFYSVRTYQIQ